MSSSRFALNDGVIPALLRSLLQRNPALSQGVTVVVDAGSGAATIAALRAARVDRVTLHPSGRAAVAATTPVDLLWLHARDYWSVAHDIAAWLPRLAAEAVVVIDQRDGVDGAMAVGDHFPFSRFKLSDRRERMLVLHRVPRPRTLYLCGGMQGGGSTLVSWCFLQRPDLDGVLGVTNADIQQDFSRVLSDAVWVKMTIGCFRLAEIATLYEAQGWDVRPVLVRRDLAGTLRSLRGKPCGFDGSTGEEPPLLVRAQRYLADLETARARGWPILNYEDLMSDPVAELRRVTAALGLPWDQAMVAWPKPEAAIAYAHNGNASFGETSQAGNLLATLEKYRLRAPPETQGPDALDDVIARLEGRANGGARASVALPSVRYQGTQRQLRDADARHLVDRLRRLDETLARIQQHVVFGRLLGLWHRFVNPTLPAPAEGDPPALPAPIRRALRPLSERWFPPRTAYRVRQRVPAQRQRRRVMHLLANFKMGGSSRLVVDLIEHLGHAYEQEVVTGFAPYPSAYVGVRVTEVNEPGALRAHLERCAPDIVHVHYWGEAWYDMVFEALNALGCKVILNVNTPVAPHASARAERCIYVSDYVLRTFGRGQGRESVIHPGSDFPLFTRAAGAEPGTSIGMVYRLEPDKLDGAAIEPFIKVVQRRPATRALIVGSGSYLDAYKRAVRQANVEGAFHFAGSVPYAELPRWYAQMSVFIAPVHQESFGQVVPFAMSMELPVAGYAVGALPEILGDRELLVPPGDSGRLAACVASLLEAPGRQRLIGERNRQRAHQLFSVENMIREYERVYGEVIERT